MAPRITGRYGVRGGHVPAIGQFSAGVSLIEPVAVPRLSAKNRSLISSSGTRVQQTYSKDAEYCTWFSFQKLMLTRVGGFCAPAMMSSDSRISSLPTG